MRTITIIFNLLSLAHHLPAQTASPVMGARAAAMGNNSVVISDGASLMNNIGSLAKLKKSGSYFSYEINPSLTGANRMSANLHGKAGSGVAGIGVFRFGDALYNEQYAIIGYAHEIGITSLGVSFTYLQNQAQGFGTASAWMINFGGITRITPHISVGALMTNITQQYIGDQLLPTRLVAGMGFRPLEAVIIVTEVDKDLVRPAIWRVGAEYVIRKRIFLRTGFTHYPTSGSFGIGFVIKKLTIDSSMVFSHELGTTIQVSATFRFSAVEKKQ